jgi:hypothetical protein
MTPEEVENSIHAMQINLDNLHQRITMLRKYTERSNIEQAGILRELRDSQAELAKAVAQFLLGKEVTNMAFTQNDEQDLTEARQLADQLDDELDKDEQQGARPVHEKARKLVQHIRRITPARRARATELPPDVA